MSSTGYKIRERRKKLGMTQAALAQEVGVSASYLNLIENGKRPIGGRLLIRLAELLETNLDALDDAEERRLVAALREIAADPLVRENAPSTERLSELVATHADWARAALQLHRAYADRDRLAAALADRLNQDPVLSERVHQLLSHASAIRSASEILSDTDDMAAAQAARFHRILAEESGRLSEVSRALARFFEKSETDRLAITPGEEIDDFLQGAANHFPELEDAAERVRFVAELDGADSAEAALRRRLERTHSRPRVVTEAGGLETTAEIDALDLGAESRRFRLARVVVQEALGDLIEAIVARAEPIRSDAAARRARKALANYAAAAVLMPYARFHAEALARGYDVEALADRFGVSYEQAAHRLVTLRRPGAQGAPFAFMRVDPSGYVSKRFALPNLPLPRIGGACPLWSVYRAFQTPEATLTQWVEMPNGERFLFIARALSKGRGGFAARRHLFSVMLACEAVHADQTVYAAARGSGAEPEPVGATCRLCPRRDCSARQEELLIS